MKRDADAILNAELSHAIASMGHTDHLMVVDAGYPVPADAWRIDLAVTRGVPSVFEVLELVNDHLIAERVMFAEDVPEMNPDMHAFLTELYEGSGAELEPIPHEEVLGYGPDAKAIVRTGDFLPWGNVVIQCGTDPKPWFDGENVTMPEEYRRRYEEIYGESP